MMRRLCAVVLYAAALAWMSGGHDQARAADTPRKLARIAFVTPQPLSSAMPGFAVFRDRLIELGWIEGESVVIDQFSGEGHLERLPELMAEGLARNPDVLVTTTTPGALAAKKATSTVPIVVASMGDPVQTGVVSNLARPGGNLTALSTGYVDGFAGKWLELLLETVPQTRRVAILWNLGNPVVRPYRKDLEAVAAARAVKLRFIDVREPRGMESAFQEAKHAAQGSVVVCENLFIENRQQVVDLAAKYRLPTVYCLSGFARAGGLISYGTDLMPMYRRAAEYVDKILRGTKVGDLPVEQPTKFELVVNVRTAKALGLTIPESILLRADEVIR